MAGYSVRPVFRGNGWFAQAWTDATLLRTCGEVANHDFKLVVPRSIRRHCSGLYRNFEKVTSRLKVSQRAQQLHENNIGNRQHSVFRSRICFC